MFVAAIAAPIVFVLFKYVWTDDSAPMDGFSAAGLVLIPVMLVGVLAVFIPSPYIGFAEVLYWIVPAVMLKQGSTISWGKAILQGFVIFVIVTVSSIAIYLLFNGAD